MSERIVAVALCRMGKVWQLPPPNRHHNVIAVIHSETGKPVLSDYDQGFMTDTGRFVGRKQAWRIADEAGQIIERFSGPQGILFSENLW